MVYYLLYNHIWQGLPTDTSCLQCNFLSFLLVFGLGCALAKDGLLSWTKEFMETGLCSNHVNSISIVWETSGTCLCFELPCYWYQLWMPSGLTALLSQSRWVLYWSGELLCLFSVLMLSTAHWVVSSVLFLSVLDANTCMVYSYSRSFDCLLYTSDAADD